jgi:hypothetical protein
LESAPLTALFTMFVNGAFAAGSLDADLRQMWGSCSTITLTKDAGGHRPISMGNVPSCKKWKKTDPPAAASGGAVARASPSGGGRAAGGPLAKSQIMCACIY